MSCHVSGNASLSSENKSFVMCLHSDSTPFMLQGFLKWTMSALFEFSVKWQVCRSRRVCRVESFAWPTKQPTVHVPHEWNWPKICCRVVRITENLFKSSSFLFPPSCVTWGLAGLLPEDDFAESVWLMEFSSCHINLNTVTKVVFNASAVVLWVVSSGKTLSVCAGVRVCVFLWAWNTHYCCTRLE